MRMHCIIVAAINALARCFLCLWDGDFSKVTKEEKRRIDIASEEMRSGIYFSEVDVWGE